MFYYSKNYNPIPVSNFFNEVDRFLKPTNYSGYDYLEEKDDKLNIYFSIPAVKKENFNIKTNNDTLLVELFGVKKDSLAHTLGVREFKKEWKIPKDYKSENIKAKYEDGVLLVSVEKNKTKTKELVVKVE